MAWNWVKKEIKKRVRNIRTWKPEDRKACIVLTGGFLVLIVSACLGEIHRRDAGIRDREGSSQVVFGNAWVQEVSFLEALTARSVKALSVGSAEALTAGDVEAFLGQEQREFLCQLEVDMAKASVHQAAGQLSQKRERLLEILEAAKKATGQEVLYLCDGQLVPSLDGMGLAIRSDTTCFYGNFREGRPEGVCTAIACLEGEAFGYGYSMGIWKNGQMEGLGITGRYSWKKEGQTKGLEEQVSGVFQEDYMEGRLTYEQIDYQGRTLWWEIMAESGKTCLDQRWVFWQGLGEYRLLSEREKRAFFVLPERFLGQVWWKNRVPWE